MKKCSKCEEVKELGEFHKDKSKKDGLRGWCKICWRKRKRDVHNKSENQKESMKKWLSKKAKRPLQKEDNRLKRVQRKVRSYFNKKYYERDRASRKTYLEMKVNHCTKNGYDFICMMDCNKYYIVRCSNGHLTKKTYETMRNGCNTCKSLRGHITLKEEAYRRGYKVLGEYKSTGHKIDMICDQGHSISMEVKSFLKGSGCKACNNIGGYSYVRFHGDSILKNKKALFYEFFFMLNGRSYKEFGITINWKGRLSAYKNQGVKPFDVSLTKMKLYDAFICEQELKNRKELQDLRLKENPGFDGWTECFDVTDVNLFSSVHNT